VDAPEGGAAPRPQIEGLKPRRDFLAAARARKTSTPGVTLQARDRGDGGPVRVGFTCSRKVGKAVSRNRAKRRLRALAREVLADHGRRGWDYVFIGRPGETVTRDYARMRREVVSALARLHGEGGR